MEDKQVRKYYKGLIYTKCPYYMGEARQHIKCEGYVFGTVTATCFYSENQKQRHQREYCFNINRYRDCPQCVFIDVKYKQIEEGLREEDTDIPEESDDDAL